MDKRTTGKTKTLESELSGRLVGCRVGDLISTRPSTGTDHVFEIEAADVRSSRQGTGYDVLHLALRVAEGTETGRRVRVQITATEFGMEEIADLVEAIGIEAETSFDAGLLLRRWFRAFLEREDRFYRLSDIRAVESAE